MWNLPKDSTGLTVHQLVYSCTGRVLVCKTVKKPHTCPTQTSALLNPESEFVYYRKYYVIHNLGYNIFKLNKLCFVDDDIVLIYRSLWVYIQLCMLHGGMIIFIVTFLHKLNIFKTYFVNGPLSVLNYPLLSYIRSQTRVIGS